MHSNEDMHGRISRLEAEVLVMQKDRETARREHREDMDKLFDMLRDLSNKLAAHVPCPAPGACIRIEDEVKEIRGSIATLEAARNKQVGERTVWALVCSAIGGVLVFVFDWFFKR